MRGHCLQRIRRNESADLSIQHDNVDGPDGVPESVLKIEPPYLGQS